MNRLPYPPMTEISQERQFTEIRKYLFRLVEELNNSLNVISSAAGLVETAAPSADADIPATELKNMIIRNAQVAQDAVDELSRSIALAYATKQELTDLNSTIESTYATQSSLSDLSTSISTTYATKQELTDFGTSVESTYATQTALSELSTTIEETYATKTELAGCSRKADASTLPNFPEGWITEPAEGETASSGKVLLLSESSEQDKYYLLFQDNGKLWMGYALNGAGTITWIEK